MRGDCWSLLGIIAMFWAQVLTTAGDPTPCSCGTACPSSPPDDAFVDAATIIPHLQVNLRYASTLFSRLFLSSLFFFFSFFSTAFHNFVGSPIDGYRCPRCILTRGAAEALVPIQKQLLAQNSSIKVYLSSFSLFPFLFLFLLFSFLLDMIVIDHKGLWMSFMDGHKTSMRPG